jgi:hypothetical protein
MEDLKEFTPMSEIRQGFPLSPLLLKILLEILAREISKRKK